MGIETVTLLAIGSAAMSAVSGFVQAGAARTQAKMQANAAVQQAQLQYQETARQQQETNRVTQEQKSDRMRKASQELGTLRVLSGERGVGGQTFNALASEIGYYEGLDLSRIESNRKATMDAGDASNKAVHLETTLAVKTQRNKAKTAMTGAVLNAISSGLQIGTKSATPTTSTSATTPIV